MSIPDPKSELTEHDLEVRRQTLQEILDNAPKNKKVNEQVYKDVTMTFTTTKTEAENYGYNNCLSDLKQIITNMMK